MRIIFLGTPEFARVSLQAIVESGMNVVAVITSTDKYGGRGKKKLIVSAVKQYALDQDIPCLQPPNLKAPAFIEELKSFQADIQIVVAFRMLPVVVWDMPPLGSYNLHGSLLPKYRGAAPINWAFINGEAKTGITIFKLKHEIDTGNILMRREMPIGPNETVGEVHDKMMVLGATAMVEAIRMIEYGDAPSMPQEESGVTKAPKLYAHMCELDFHQDAVNVHNFIRGLSPYPGAWIIWNELKLKLLKSTVDDTMHDLRPGTMISDNSSYLKIAARSGFVNIHFLQLQGKKAMKTKDFLNGNKIA